MKYLFFFLSIVLAQTCDKTLPKYDSIVTAITANEIHFLDGHIQRFPKAKSNDATVFFLVRHAEKKTDKNDPDLTPEGHARAERLAQILKGSNLFKVYSTTYTRTINTALPTIRALDVEQGSYRPDKLGEFVDTLLEHQKGKRFLIVGHSNTTPNIMNHLLGNSVYEEIDHDDYGNLFIVFSKGAGDSEVIELRF